LRRRTIELLRRPNALVKLPYSRKAQSRNTREAVENPNLGSRVITATERAMRRRTVGPKVAAKKVKALARRLLQTRLVKSSRG